jgi:hypothetical protein
MAVIKKTLFAENLDKYNTFVVDTAPNSTYFNVTEIPDAFTGGKNAFLIAGSKELVADTLVKIEIKDAAGNTIYHEPGEGIVSSSINGESFISEYYEGVSKVVAVYVYPDTTAYGPCTITILGELSSYYDGNGLLTPIPIDWQGTYNVKWQRSVNVNPTLANTTKIRFYRRPTASITEVLSPIYRIENGSKVDSGVNQSFAEIKLSQLETFAGDVKRVKVFRTSEGDISDFNLIQDILVESKELLTTTQLTGSVIGNTGTFTSEVLPLFWNTGSLTTELASSRVESGLKLNGSGLLTYSQSLDIKATNTYELNLDAFYSSSTASNLGIYISGSDGGDVLIGTLNGITPTKNLSDTVIPFKLDSDFQSGSLYFSQSQGEWHVGNISLRLSEDTAFSPDEISFITTMPTVIGNETYNFKFEFYDVNNNFVPVAVTQSANFTGGTAGQATKLLTFDSDRTAFRFSTGSFGNPAFQQLGFKVSKSNLSGSVTYASSAFDVGGNYIVPASYAGTYPGTLTNTSDAGATLTIANFSGSVSSIIVGSIVYTASCEGLEQFETVYRFEDGDNAPGVFVTSNTNQFIYKATDLSINPSGQTITIEAKRKNLASATTPLTVNSGSGKPPLTLVSTNSTNGVDTYTIAGTDYSFGTGETTYFISGSDQFGNQFSDAVTITPVKILDGLSATLTNDNASLPALSNGFVASGSFILTSGSVTVKVGNESISFDDDNDSVRANNTFALTNLSGIGCTPNGGNNSNPTTNSYSITNLTQDSGSLDITISYKDGAGDTTSIIKNVTYTKNKKAAPVLAISSTPKDQSVTAKSTGAQIDSFLNSTIVVKETYNGSTITLPATLTATRVDTGGSLTVNNTTGVVTLSNQTLADGINSTTVNISAIVTDSEGTSRTVTDTLSLSKVKKAVPLVLISASPQAQSVLANAAGTQTGTLSNVTISALEGTTSRFTSMTIASTSGFSTPPTVSSATLTMTSAVMNAAEASITLTVTHTDSEGTTGQTQTIIVRATKVPTGAAGANGTNGTNGATGGDGPGVVFRGPWSAATTYNSISQDATRKDVVLYSGTYYATKANATANLNKQPNTQTAFWESLGTDSFFVAAEMIISKESYVQNTINVGTNTSGNANITIAGGSTSPYISIGQSTQGFNNNGIFIGTSSGAQKLSLKSASNSLTWDGTTLNIVGNLSVGSSVPNSVVTGLGGLATQNTVSTGQVTGLGALATLSTVTNAQLAANAVEAGNIAANAVTSGKISANAVTAGTIAAGAVTAGTIAANAVTAGTIAAGSVTADKITVSELSALGATIGGWSINSTVISKSTGAGTITLDSSNNKILLNDASATRFEVSTGTSTDPASNPRRTTINNGGFIVSTDSERYFRHNTAGGLPFSGKSLVFNDSKGGLRVDGLFFNSPLTSTDFFKTSAAADENDSLNTTYWLPRTQEAMIYDRPGSTYSEGSFPNTSPLVQGGGVSIGTSTFRVHTGTVGADSVQPLRFKIDDSGDVQVIRNIQCYQNVIAYYSDKRLKNIIGKIENPLDKIQKLNGVYYTQNEVAENLGYEKNDTKQVGLIAQEVQEVLPEIVSIAPIDKDGNGGSRTGEDYLTIDYSKVVPLLVECIKELKREIEELKKNK